VFKQQTTDINHEMGIYQLNAKNGPLIKVPGTQEELGQKTSREMTGAWHFYEYV